ncbi:MAG: DUF370 domain-containing protein [Chloroflexota bacterium]|nr:DUF370 domain-containing protein [Chloroflexota bacterium]
MATELIHVGFGNFLAIDRVVAIVSPNSAPVKRMVTEAKNKGQVVDLTSGRKTKATLLMDTGHIILAGISSETIAGRVESKRLILDLQGSSDSKESKGVDRVGEASFVRGRQ